MSLMKTQNYCISVDWLQVCCHSTNIDSLLESPYFVARESCPYILSDTGLMTRSFSHLFHVLCKLGNQYHKCAEIQLCPRSAMLDRNLVLLKLENRFLYHEGYIKMLYDLCGMFHLEIKGITRLDLCYDCNRFFAGVDPKRFIQQFVSHDFEDSHYIHKAHTHSFRIYADRGRSAFAKFTGIEFGSKKSATNSYIYDKSIELSTQKNKPWIREVWEKNGLLNDKDNHVWRSEISIKADGSDLLHMGTGELFRLSPAYLENQEAIEKLFHIYAARCFNFKLRGNARDVRHFVPMTLFENSREISVKPIKVNRFADTGRTEKICANVLDKLCYTYSDLSAEYTSALQRCITFLREVSGLKDALKVAHQNCEELNNFLGRKWIEQDSIDYFAMVELLSHVRYDFRSYVPQPSDSWSSHYSMQDDSLEIYYSYLEWINHKTE